MNISSVFPLGLLASCYVVRIRLIIDNRVTAWRDFCDCVFCVHRKSGIDFPKRGIFGNSSSC